MLAVARATLGLPDPGTDLWVVGQFDPCVIFTDTTLRITLRAMPDGSRKPKRHRDLNQLAKSIVDEATGQTEPVEGDSRSPSRGAGVVVG